jgi:hypothetical protein
MNGLAVAASVAQILSLFPLLILGCRSGSEMLHKRSDTESRLKVLVDSMKKTGTRTGSGNGWTVQPGWENAARLGIKRGMFESEQVFMNWLIRPRA